MAMITETQSTAGFSGSFLSGMMASLTSFISMMTSRKTLTALDTLNDAMLRDIGLQRGDLCQARMAPLSVDPVVMLMQMSRAR